MGEPLYLDVRTALTEAADAGTTGADCDATSARVVGGRYGLSSKELTPAMVKGVFDELASDQPKRHFTVGIYDDVTHLSLPTDPAFVVSRRPARCRRCSSVSAPTGPSARTRPR